ncbi:MAG: TetR/AcrR family transcriptional regulator [Myxococcales bacterium]|nr:TetR/AcrR family transcriptional regulator [Myxococcales bacterium]
MPPKSKSKRSYHHGDLRAAILAGAVEVIAERGLHGLSLRECARRAGVSHAAPYRHFADKDALLRAIARQGFEWLSEAGRRAMEGVTRPRDRLDGYGAAYVRFAVEHPVHHRVMFASELPNDPAAREGAGDEGAGDEEDDAGAFTLLVETAAELVAPGVDPTPTAVASWSLVHGLAMLILDGRIPAEVVSSPDEAEAFARELFAQWRGALR